MKTTSRIIVVVASLFAASLAAAQEKEMTSDEVRAAVQKICPVSGLKLGDHGDPIRAKIGEQEVFLCCKSCKNGKVKKEHWTKIHKNFATAQGICLVMENDLPKNPEWTIVNGRLFYVCCPPCIEKIEADPDAYATKLDAIYAAHVKQPDSR